MNQSLQQQQQQRGHLEFAPISRSGFQILTSKSNQVGQNRFSEQFPRLVTEVAESWFVIFFLLLFPPVHLFPPVLHLFPQVIHLFPRFVHLSARLAKCYS